MISHVYPGFKGLCKYIGHHVYPINQGTHDKLNQIRLYNQMFEENKENSIFNLERK